MPSLDRKELIHPSPDFVLNGLAIIGKAIKKINKNQNPCENNASSFNNHVFKMNAYNWLSISMPEEEFSFNFKCDNFYVSWYKYLGRATFQSKDIKIEEWDLILNKCLKSLEIKL